MIEGLQRAASTLVFVHSQLVIERVLSLVNDTLCSNDGDKDLAAFFDFVFLIADGFVEFVKGLLGSGLRRSCRVGGYGAFHRTYTTYRTYESGDDERENQAGGDGEERPPTAATDAEFWLWF